MPETSSHVGDIARGGWYRSVGVEQIPAIVQQLFHRLAKSFVLFGAKSAGFESNVDGS